MAKDFLTDDEMDQMSGANSAPDFISDEEMERVSSGSRVAVPDMTAGSVAKDVLSGALQIGPTAIKGVADIARLATGDRVGKDTSDAMATGMDAIRSTVGSERAAAQRENFNRDMADDNVGIGQALLNNKGAIADQVLPTIGSMFLPVGVAGAAGKLASTGKAVQAMDAAAISARVASAQQAAGIGAVAAQNAADSFSTLLEKGHSMEDAYIAAGITVPFSIVAGALTKGGAEGALTRALTGTGAVKAGVGSFVKASGQEGAQEMGEELGQIAGEAGGTGELPSLVGAGKQLAVAGTLGAVMGGGVNVATQAANYGKPAEPAATADPITSGDEQFNAALQAINETDDVGQMVEAALAGADSFDLESVVGEVGQAQSNYRDLDAILSRFEQDQAESAGEEFTPSDLGSNPIERFDGYSTEQLTQLAYDNQDNPAIIEQVSGLLQERAIRDQKISQERQMTRSLQGQRSQDWTAEDTKIDPVNGFITELRNTNTPAAQAMLREIASGRVTNAEITQIISQQREQASTVEADQRLQQAAAQAVAPSADGIQTVTPSRQIEPRMARIANDFMAGRATRANQAQVQQVADQEGEIRQDSPAKVEQHSSGAPLITLPAEVAAQMEGQLRSAFKSVTGKPLVKVVNTNGTVSLRATKELGVQQAQEIVNSVMPQYSQNRDLAQVSDSALGQMLRSARGSARAQVTAEMQSRGLMNSAGIENAPAADTAQEQYGEQYGGRTGLEGQSPAREPGDVLDGSFETGADEVSQRVASSLQSAPQNQGKKITARVVNPSTHPGKSSKIKGAVVQALANFFNKKVVWFEAEASQDGVTRSEATGGFVQGGDTIYANINGRESPIAIVMHELSHMMEKRFPKAYEALLATVKADFAKNPEKMAELRAEYEGMRYKFDSPVFWSEVVADIVGNRAMDPKFWANVFTRIAMKHGKPEAQTIVTKLRNAVVKMIAGAIAQIPPSTGFKSYVTDMQSVSDAVETAAARWIEGVRLGESEANTDESGAEVQFAAARLTDEQKQVWATRGEAAEDRSYDMGIAKGPRVKKTTSSLTADEKQRIASNAKEYGFTADQVADEVRSIKNNYPASEGWAQPVFNQIAEKGDNLNSRIEFKEIPYSFHIPPGWDSEKAPSPHGVKSAAWVAEMANRTAKEIVALSERATKGDAVAKTIIDHMTWYREMARRLRDEFGGFGDAFADLLGATSPNTPVRTNWNFSVDGLRRFVRGEFDEKLAAYEKAIAGGIGPKAFREQFGDQLLTQISGAQYGINSVNAAKALVGMWRAVKKGDAPKARNFALNLIGQSDKATIDVWAARMLQRLAKQNRIPPKAEGAVSGNHATDVENVTGQFGFGQLVFEKAVKQLQAQGLDITAPDLQAVAWFLEKEIWTKNGWTRVLGSEGSFEQEADKMPVDRYQAGATIQQDVEPEDSAMAEARDEMTASLKSDSDVIAYRALPTLGMYAGSKERSFDQEIIATRGWSPSKWIADVAKTAKKAKQWDAFFSRVLRPNENHPNARPGVEVYFKTQQDLEKTMPALEAIVANGIDGFTLVVDPLERRNLEGGKQASKFIGVRLQYVPEIALRWMDKNSDEYQKLSSGDAAKVQEVLDDKSARIDAAVADLQGRDGVAFVKAYEYDTLVIGKENYDAYTDSKSREADRPFGGDSSGQPISERLQAAVSRMEGKSGGVGAGDVLQRSPDGVQLSADRSNATGSGSDGASLGEIGKGQRLTAEGIHYSKEQRNTLRSHYFSTGLKGAELDRVNNAKDERIKHRIYFYVNAGRGINPESGVGGHAHKASLSNLYDLQQDPKDLVAKYGANPNGLESAILDAGYSGHLSRDFGVAVLLGEQSIDVEYLGMKGKTDSKAIEPIGERSELGKQRDAITKDNSLPSGELKGSRWKEIMAKKYPDLDLSHLEDDKGYYKSGLVKKPDVQFSLSRQTETPEFKKWFGDWDHPKAFTSKFPADKTTPSMAMDFEANKPLVLFHATNADFNEFETGRESITSTTFGPVETKRHAIFTTPDVKFAESYLKKGGGQNVMPVYMDIKAPMDLRNNGAWDYVDELVNNGFENHRWPNRSDTSMWEMFDDETGEAFVAAAKKAGYDGAIMFEVDDNDKMVEVYVAFDPTQIKSATGNNGQFDPANPDIRFSADRNISDIIPKAKRQKIADSVGKGFKKLVNANSFQLKGLVGKDSIEETLATIDLTGHKVLPLAKSHEKSRSAADTQWLIKSPDGKEAYVYKFGRDIQIDILNFKSEKSNGRAVYQALGAWADKRGFVFEGDSQGATLAGIVRRGENMISSILRTKNSLQWRPHDLQVKPQDNPSAKKLGVRGVRWATGEHDQNLGELLISSYNTVIKLVPEIAGIRANEFGEYENDNAEFDFTADQKVYNESDFKRLAGRATERLAAYRKDGEVDVAPIIGVATIKRAIVTQDLLRRGLSSNGVYVLPELAGAGSGSDVRAGVGAIDNALYSLDRTDNGSDASGSDRSRITETPQFKKWSEDAPLVESGSADYLGGPAVFVGYHGTTHSNITKFNRTGNKEGFLGAGPYITTTASDASDNYAGVGPDLTSRIDQEADRQRDSFEDDDYTAEQMLQDYFEASGKDIEITEENLGDLKDEHGEEAIHHAARSALKGDSDGLMMKVFVKTLNPADTTGKSADLTYEVIEDEDGNPIDESGTAVDWIMAARRVAESYGMDIEQHVDDVLSEGGEIGMDAVFRSALKRFSEVYDDNGDMLSAGAVFVEIAEEAGYDSVIMDADLHFGSGKRGFGGAKLKGMSGVERDTLHIVPFTSSQIKSATGNNGGFDASNPDIRFSGDRENHFGKLSPAQEQALRNVGGIIKPKTLAERFAEFKDGLGDRFLQGMFDQFHALKELDYGAYMTARLSKASDGTLEALMLYGKPFMNQGVPDVNIKDGGFAKVLSDLKGEQDRFLWWVAAQRAEQLTTEGRENLFQGQDITALKTLNQPDAKNPDRVKMFNKALVELNAFNDSVLKIAEESGLIDAQARQLFKDAPYVPFYRVLEDPEAVAGPRMSSGLMNQKAWKKLKGGKSKLSSDLLANTLQNWNHLFTASAKNRAALRAMDVSTNLGVAHQVPSGTKGAVKVARNGTYEYWVIDDPMVHEAISALEAAAPSWWRPFAAFKRAFTWGVTINPTFKVRNLIRDSISAIGVAELSGNVAKNVVNGWKATAHDSQTRASMLAGGGMIHFGTLEANSSDKARRLIADGVDKSLVLDDSGFKKLLEKVKTVYDTYQEYGDRTENVNRAALYEHLLAKGYTREEANFMARDLMDFSMSGRWPVVRFLAQGVPFMNARLQGLYKLGRAANENPKRMGYVVGAVVLASLALMLAQGDDEDYKALEDWKRDAYWCIKIGGQMYYIPKPFEIGAMGTLAERSWEMAFKKDMDMARYGERLSAMIFQTFAMNPIPQFVKPIYDVYANRDPFGGKPIENMAMERLRPEDRSTERTSQAAILLGQLGLPNPVSLTTGKYDKLSPVQIDYLVRGYMGWVGTTTTTALDYGIRPMMNKGERPEMRLRDIFFVGNFVESLPSGSSRYLTQFYNDSKAINQAYASHRDALKRGDRETAKEIMEEEGDKVKQRKKYDAAADDIADLNRRIKQIERSKNWNAETKRKMIERLETNRNKIAERITK